MCFFLREIDAVTGTVICKIRTIDFSPKIVPFFLVYCTQLPFYS